ncbi:hypothetical protein MATL_G00042170 [Megalops atlanticus]|uniref:Serine-threonine/tyrosine-protein kinase catalytic domain-containing protein n=1 Tax=Megalops atlanticus TaxID=7932 RepID=A0A9D3TIB8_MEGAT|nr:hypothetical protein MATL_G00042170 [Megalops atlanticus]
MPLLPCPVRLGVVKDGGPAEQLHKYTMERSLHKMEKLLKKGVEVDSVNDLGQTALFCASLLGHTSAVELLLRYGADPNHLCEDRSTPVHAAVFSCNPWLLSEVLDAGGDLRLHDCKGHTPQDWAKAGGQEHSPRMVDFLKRCMSHMLSLSQPRQPQDVCRTPGSSKTLLHSPSLLELLRPGGSDLHVNRKLSSKSSLCDTVQCFGFGKLCIEKPRQPLGLLASLPVIVDSELGQADDEATVSYSCGALIRMTNYSWKGCRVTVKELQCQGALQHGSQEGYLDMLLIEQEYCSHLVHPHLLQLLAVSMSADLQRPGWSLRGCTLGLSIASCITGVMSSPCCRRGGAVIVHPGVAKVTNLGFIVPSREGGGPSDTAHLPLPQGLYNWAAPEVIRRRACTGKADLYSMCALIQELYTDAVPWGPVDPRWIRQAVELGQALTADLSVPQPYYQLVRNGLQPRAQDRTNSLQDLRYLLRCDIRELYQSGSGRKSGVCSEAEGFRAAGWTPESKQNGEQGHTGCGPMAAREAEREQRGGPSDSMVDREIQDQLSQLDQLLEREAEGVQGRQGEGDEALTDSDQSSLLRETSSCEILTLDDCRLSLYPELDVSQESGSESSAGWGEPEWARQRVAPPPGPPSKESEHLSSIVLNLKVSQVLLQQSESSLRTVEEALGAGGAEGRPCAGATGPPSRSYRPSHGLCPQAQRPQGASREYPFHGGEDICGGQSKSPSFGDEEQSYYSSAQEESFVNVRPTNAQAGRSGVSPGGIERGRQQNVREQQSTSRQDGEDRTYVLSGMLSSSADSLSPPRSRRSDEPKAKWTSEVSELVARMARGHLGATPCPGSSDSEEAGSSDRPGRGQDPHVADSSHSSAELEHLLKSFAGDAAAGAASVQSESEEDADFHTVNRTLSMTWGAWEGAGRREEEETSDSDYAQSPVEPSSMFYTPNPELQPHATGRCSQTPSSEGDLEVTAEVCRPAPGTAGAAAETRREEIHSPVGEPAATRPAASQNAPFAVPSCLPEMAELAELSSITCSPAQHQEWAGQESQQPSPFGRRAAPCNSTPRSPEGGPRPRPADGCDGPLPHLPSLLDTTPWSNTPSRPPTTETFATATLGDTSTTGASVSSVLHSPMQGDSNASPKKTASNTGLPELTTASLGKRQPESMPGNNVAMRRREDTPAGRGETAEADSSEGEVQTAGGGAAVVAENGGEGTAPEAEGNSEHSEPGGSDPEQVDANIPAKLRDATTPAAGVPEGGKEIPSDEQEMHDDKEMPDEDRMPDGEMVAEEEEEEEEEEILCVGSEWAEGSGSSLSPGSAVLVCGALEQKGREKGLSTEACDLLEGTERAHSTLDEDLQGMLLQIAAGQRFARSPETIGLPKMQDGERPEKMSHPSGDSVEAVAAAGKVAEPSDGASAHQGK